MRDPVTYRTVRREEWREVKAFHGGDLPWADYNTPAPKYQLGTLPPRGHALIVSRSKYMPHNGKREMERRRSRMAAA